MRKLIVTLTGPSCAGKSTLEKCLVQRGFGSVMSTTTRPMRPGEIDGVHYDFISEEEFKRMAAQDELMESIQYGDHFYGATVKNYHLATQGGKTAVVVVEPAGKRQIAHFCATHHTEYQHFSIFMTLAEQLILQRWLTRTANDLDTHEKIAGHARRLVQMTGIERAWCVAVEQGFDGYNMVVNHFDHYSQDAWLNKITNAIQRKAVIA